jgi:hypothetical protein
MGTVGLSCGVIQGDNTIAPKTHGNEEAVRTRSPLHGRDL